MRGLRVVLAMLVGACIGVSVVVMFYRHRFGWPASVPAMVVPMCLVIAIVAIRQWRSLDVEITEAVDRAIEALPWACRFEASFRKSLMIGAAVATLFLVAMLFAPTRDAHSLGHLAVAVLALLSIASGMMLFGWALKPGPTLVMDTRGLRHAAFGCIPWAAIVGLQYTEHDYGSTDTSYTARTLHIAIASPHRFAHQLSALTRFLRPSLTSPATRFGELAVSLNALDEPHEVIVAAAFEFRGRDDAPFAVGWEPGMASGQLAALLAMETNAPALAGVTP